LKFGRCTVAAAIHSPRRVLVIGPPRLETMRTGETRVTYKTIVVATDLSDGAAGALRWAARIGRHQGAVIHLAHVLPAGTGDVPRSVRSDLDAGSPVIESVVQDRGVEVSPHYLAGEPWRCIVDLANEHDADLIVLGGRGDQGTPSRRSGATADRVIRSAGCPVLALHASGSHTPSLRTALAAVDFSAGSCLAARHAAAILRSLRRDGRLVLVHALHVPVDYTMLGASPEVIAGDFDRRRQQAGAMLEGLAIEVRGGGLTVETVVAAGYPLAVIQDTAAEVDADMIALGTVGRSGLRHFFLGSVAERVMHRTPGPVLTVRDLRAASSAHAGTVGIAELA
jgi:nucleotide-binding universal stress UspA family protein